MITLLIFQGHRELLRDQWVRISEVDFDFLLAYYSNNAICDTLIRFMLGIRLRTDLGDLAQLMLTQGPGGQITVSRDPWTRTVGGKLHPLSKIQLNFQRQLELA